MRTIGTSITLIMLSLSSSAHADNWGHWRGPTGNGAADSASPPTEWSSTKNVKWKVELPGRGSSSPVVWEIVQDTPDIASPLLSSARLYFHKGKSGLLSCVDAATGKPHYMASRIQGLDGIYASPVAAGGHVYLTSRTGTTVVIRDADELSIVATNDVDETVDATPAPVDSELFIRGEKHLFCIAVAE